MAGNAQADTQRIHYFDGQLLAARDLQDDVAYEARLRGLHVRALHNTWGVALGFAVKLVQDAAAVEVSPGIAYDCRGREIVSARTLLVGLPPRPTASQANAWLFDLVISYNTEFGRGRGLDEVCLGSGPSPNEERPVWRWRFAGDAITESGSTPRPDPLRLGEEIPLARFTISTTAPRISPPDFSVRRAAEGLVRPHIAGAQVQGQMEPAEEELRFTLQIDTTAAGFNQTPYYFAGVTIPLLLNLAMQGGDMAEFVHRLLGPFVSIRSAWRRGFTLDVRFAVANLHQGIAISPGAGLMLALNQVAAAGRTRLPVVVNWVGLEPTGGCAPSPLALPWLFYLAPIFTITTAGTVGNLLAILNE